MCWPVFLTQPVGQPWLNALCGPRLAAANVGSGVCGATEFMGPACTSATVTTGVNLDVSGFVSPLFSRSAVEGSASQVVVLKNFLSLCATKSIAVEIPVVQEQAIGQAIVVVGSLPPSEEFTVPVYNHIYQGLFSAGETTENIAEFPVVPEQVIVQAIPRVAGTLPPVDQFTPPVYNPVHQEQFSASDTSENFANIPVVQEQLLVQATPRFGGSLPPVHEFTACVARRSSPLVEVRPSERAQRHAVEGLGEFAPMAQILDAPVPQMVDYVAQALRLLDRPIAEQVLAVPTVSCSSCPSRSRVSEPQSADQLIEVPTVLTPTRIALQIAEQIVDTPVPRGRVHGSLPRQSSAMSLPESIEWVELSDANGRCYFWNRRTQATVRKAPPGVQVVWVGVKDEVGATWYWHRLTRATGYLLPPLPPE